MLMTNQNIMDSVQVLSQATQEKGLLGYAIAVNTRKLTDLPEMEAYSKKRDELLAEYGEDAGDGRYNFTAEAAAAFREALQPYADIETDVQVMQVTPEVFYSGGLTSAQMFALNWMVKEG